VDTISPVDRRLWRAADIPPKHLVVWEIRLLDPSTGDVFVHANFACVSQTEPRTGHYLGSVAFNGTLESSACECADFGKAAASMDGQAVCKHVLAALLRLGFISRSDTI